MMRSPLLLLISLIGLLLSACGGSPPRHAEVADGSLAPPTSQQAAPPPAEPAPATEYDSVESEAAAEESAGAMPAPSPRRPGLATQWGEERESHVHEVFFRRQRPHKPAGLLRVHYDDEIGVQAVTGRHPEDAYPRTFPIQGGALVISITDEAGNPLAGLHAGGTDYIVGEHGDRYQIQITNHTGGRFEIIASVDGLDVLDGQEGSLEKRGYLVAPWSTLTIEGFRDSYDTVRAFRFGDVEDSYAARRGKGRNVGVIGVAVFEEQGFHFGYDDDEIYRRRTAEPFPNRFAPAPH